MEKSDNLHDKIGIGAELGLCTIAAIQFVSVTTLDISLWVSLYCFSAAIPLLACTYFMLVSISQYGDLIRKWYFGPIAAGGILIGFAGLAACLWHFSVIASAVFTVLSLIAIGLWTDYDSALREANSKRINK